VTREDIVHLRPSRIFGSVLCVTLVLSGHTALAHHVMGGKLPASFGDGLLSGLGHPLIGIDHFAAVVAVGILAAAHRLGPALVIGYVLAQVAGAALHVREANIPAAEFWVALTVIALGAVLIRRQTMSAAVVLGLFVVAGLFHGYALGESIVGAERTPLAAYFAGFAAIQIVVALAAMMVARRLAPQAGSQHVNMRLIGAGIVGLGLGAVATQLLGAA
jgi:urease accessory protein